jgi:Xaa-Pro dipeptidase
MIKTFILPNLNPSGCRLRQQKLVAAIKDRELDAALICDRFHVYYFTGYWTRPYFAPVALIERDGATWLSAPEELTDAIAVEHMLLHKASYNGTLVDDRLNAAIEPLIERLSQSKRVGCIGQTAFHQLPASRWSSLNEDVLKIRRTKYDDEVDLFRFAVAAAEAAYQYAFEVLCPGITEVELFAGMQAAVCEFVGEPTGEFGNDFQICSPGGLPRRRVAMEGEVAVLDLSVNVRGYSSDLSRSFVVGRKPSDLQIVAFKRIAEVLGTVEAAVSPGVSCRELYKIANNLLSGYQGWKFGHHLGHGIGLGKHEAPRLNPHWDDVMQVGDVFTIEPGLYGENLRAGLRIEQNYYLSPSGLQCLSTFPIGLA